jgi:hypothetical protein
MPQTGLSIGFYCPGTGLGMIKYYETGASVFADMKLCFINILVSAKQLMPAIKVFYLV